MTDEEIKTICKEIADKYKNIPTKFFEITIAKKQREESLLNEFAEMVVAQIRYSQKNVAKADRLVAIKDCVKVLLGE